MKELLIFILIPKPQWGGYIVYPCCAADDGEFYSLKGKFSTGKGVTDNVREILKLCERCELSSLYENYGRKKYKTEREFAGKMSGEILKAVKSFVNRIVTEIISRIASENLPLYLRESRLESIYKQDEVIVETEPLKPLMGFFRDNEKIRYVLQLEYKGSVFKPAEPGLRIITDDPGMVLIDKKLFRLPEKFSGTRLIPFLNKDEVIILRQNEQMYFHQFILKNICDSEIEVEGFDVIQLECVKKVILSLEKNILSEPVFMLEFYYDNRLFRACEPKKVIVELKEEGNDFCFYKISRDGYWEDSVIAFIQEQGLFCISDGGFSVKGEKGWGAAVDWIEKHEDVLLSKSIVVSQSKLNVSFYTGKWELIHSEAKDSDWFQLHMEVLLEDGRRIYFQEMRDCILSGKREYMLDDQMIFIIPEEWFSRYTGIMLFGRRKNDNVILHRSQLALINADTVQNGFGCEETLEHRIEPPVKLCAELRDYQQKGYEWLYRLYRRGAGACLADDMGLGKTIQTIALLLKYKEETIKAEEFMIPTQLDLFSGDVTSVEGAGEKIDEIGMEILTEKHFRTCLIMAPASVVHNWKNELAKFAPSLTTLVYTGSGNLRNEKRKALLRWDAVITTYQTFRADVDYFAEHRFGIVVFDESQNLKNPSSMIHRAALRIEADFFVALSGTPIENSLSDLWALMEVINSGLLGTHTAFQDYFIRPIVADNKGLRGAMLHKLVAPYILRRTKEEVLQDLPDRMDEIIFCEPEPDQKQTYDEELSRTRNLIMERASGLTENNGRFVILQSLVRLRKLAIDPRLVFGEHASVSAKFRLIFGMLEEISGTGHKVLLFSDYVSFLDLIAKEMENRQWDYTMLTGSTRNREEVINRFSNSAECHFFLISLKAGGVGLNLTEADYVFILDPWWNVAAEEQAISRAHRMGQKRSVFVYRFITEGTLEEKILNLQKDKQDLVDIVIKSGIV